MIQINWKKILTYAVSLLIPLGLGALTGYLISGSMDYAMLNKPPLAPPPFLFPVAWSLLYLLMGISYGILRTRGLADTAVNTARRHRRQHRLFWAAGGQSALAGVFLCAQMAFVRVHLDRGAGDPRHCHGNTLLSAAADSRTFAAALYRVDAVCVVSQPFYVSAEQINESNIVYCPEISVCAKNL